MKQDSAPFDWKAYSNKTWVIVLAGLFVPPLGILLTWLKPGWTNKARWIATGLMLVMLVGYAGSLNDKSGAENKAGGVETRSKVLPTASDDGGASEKPATDNDWVTQWPKKKTSRSQPVDMTKVFEVRVGMSPDAVQQLLGEPHETQRCIVKPSPFTPQKDTVMWWYKGTVKDDFITIGFTDGVVEAGGAAGWDFEKGFDEASGESKKRIVQHYMDFLKRGGTPPFNARNPPKPSGT
jgi:hypothetical protein